MPYAPSTIEPKWQAHWRAERSFRALSPGDPGFDPAAPKFYVLDMFPYPSGAGLHVGHPEGYTATDILARYKRMRGFNVLHPMGWDAFGLPAEEYARSTNQHPEQAVQKNIATFRRQIEALGFSYDWERELSTTDVDYYKWTQWIFLRLWGSWFDPTVSRARPMAELPIPDEIKDDPARRRQYENGKRLAYLAEIPVWWCERLGTVMANEEVKEGKTVDKGYDCVRVPLRQWLFRITAYADRLVAGLDTVDWPEGIKKQQKEWIGKSQGAEVDFQVIDHPPRIRVFTTRPDTLFGATYMVLAPEHPLVDQLTSPGQREAVAAYRAVAAAKSEFDRSAGAKDKSGVALGAYARNPVNGEAIPVWIADYVLMTYGTGAIMAVPAHDQRDFEFATRFGLRIQVVVAPPEGAAGEPLAAAFEEEGIAVNSPWIDGLPTVEAKRTMIARLAAQGIGQGAITYRLRDWLFSRQRYWGEPFPVIHCQDGEVKAVPDEELPVRLPYLEDFSPRAGAREPMLARAADWVTVVDPATGRPARRETDTMPGWAGSCWYYLRFTDARNDGAPWAPAVERYWMPVDLYVGGAEHAVLHLLYARFWHQALFDLGHVSTAEPFQRLFNQGLILSYVATTAGGAKVPMDLVVQTRSREQHGDDAWEHKESGERLTVQVGKMSKSLKNVVNPDDVIAQYGADTLRLYEMFMGPLEVSKPWNTRDVEGPHGFLHRVFRLIHGRDDELRPNLAVDRDDDAALERALHRCIAAVTADIEGLRFNTAIARMMELVNEATKSADLLSRSQARRFVQILTPFAPHLGEELWQRLGGEGDLTRAPWPTFDPALLIDESVEFVVQVNGKVRGKLQLPPTVAREELEARAREVVAKWLEGKRVDCPRPKNDKARIVTFVARD